MPSHQSQARAKQCNNYGDQGRNAEPAAKQAFALGSARVAGITLLACLVAGAGALHVYRPWLALVIDDLEGDQLSNLWRLAAAEL